VQQSTKVAQRATSSGLKAAVHRAKPLSRTGVPERMFTLAFGRLVYPQIWEDPVLDTAAASIARAGLSSCVAVAQADATVFDPQTLFGHAQFERVMISYALSMIPPWRAALARALDVLAPGGSLHLVDFGDCAGLPGPFKAALRRWLAAFDVTPRDELGVSLAELSAERGPSCETRDRFRGYATLAVARRAEDSTGQKPIAREIDPFAP
jgi:SAM-dependent methyltransferase